MAVGTNLCYAAVVVACLLVAVARADPGRPSSLRALAARPVLVTATAAYAALGGTILLNARADDERNTRLHRDLFGTYLAPGMRVLEVGYGPGVNVAKGYYPRGVRLVGLDPAIDGSKATFDVQAATSAGNGVALEALVKGVGEALPFPDASFDAVVDTLVLCTVRDPAKALAEISRVLRPGGVFVCVEHVVADAQGAQVGQSAAEAATTVDPFLAAQQRLLNPLQQVVASGCHLDRRTDLLLAGSGSPLQVSQLRYETFKSEYPISTQIFCALIKK